MDKNKKCTKKNLFIIHTPTLQRSNFSHEKTLYDVFSINKIIITGWWFFIDQEVYFPSLYNYGWKVKLVIFNLPLYSTSDIEIGFYRNFNLRSSFKIYSFSLSKLSVLACSVKLPVPNFQYSSSCLKSMFSDCNK